MDQRTEYPTGVPCWVDLELPDPDAAAEFYAGLFGWSFVSRAPEGAPFRYLVGQLEGLDVAAIGSPADEGGVAGTWRTWVAVASADDSAALVRANGGEVLLPPADIPGAGRSALCADPAGAVFGLWEPHGTAGAQVVNDAGSWNFSDLSTKDTDAAAAFYGAVFGWVARPLDLGGGLTATMICRPGYSDWLDERDPSRRERHGADGVPDGFGDAVAWLEADDAAPARWNTTFSVDDADAAAERCERFGGTVVEAPSDLGPTRITLLRDPFGTLLTASHYRP